VLDGSLPTASGFGRLRPVEAPMVSDGLSAVIRAAESAGAQTVVHCCHRAVPVALLARTGAGAIAVDVSLLDTPRWEQVAALAEAGVRLWAGVVPTSGVQEGPDWRPERFADAVWKPWRALGLTARDAGSITVTPACGLAGSSRAGAVAALRMAKDVGGLLAERSQE